ncbi:SIR2 family protein [Paenibacillus glacialis]|uniref:Uncharacterized protein n=1 Tax=Paenibacillus glacialis TaxID=494026 RepID=A0A168LJM9_9BACL|nr:SIR2 family protein [Paenibacillus glacialis]OAB43480.1 hypothetical protein PGLA_08685 [Paenibacillus glacialis]
MSKYLFMLGNGFTIDFLNHIDKSTEVDVYNLFSQGDTVCYPGNNEPGFLSYRWCKNLWNLGARPHMNYQESIGLIEDIVTCANTASAINRTFDSVYIKAYQELTSYLKYLFVGYNKKISDEYIKNNIEGFGWYDLFKNLVSSTNTSEITIITYNYDIWLERILNIAGINFELVGMKNGKQRPNDECKVKIIKPHGSISFAYKDSIPRERFRLTSENRDETVLGNIDDYHVNYDSLDNIYSFNAMIPPAGQSLRLSTSHRDENWATYLREAAKIAAKDLTYADEAFICGLSYWHVDRMELDQILVNMNSDIALRVVNPKPSSTFNAVLTGLFKNHIMYNNSNVMGGIVIV